MKKIIYIFTVTLLISCGKEKHQVENTFSENLTQKQIDSVLTDFKFEYNNPIYIDSTNFVLLPITTKNTSSNKLINKSSYSYTDSRTKYWNILFYNSTSEKISLLTESKMSISDFDYNLREVGSILSKSILYKIRLIDYNNDGKLNHKDPEYLFISKNSGTELKRLSPENENLLSYSIIPKTNQLIIKTSRDTNNDFKFDVNDAIIWYKIDLQLNSKPLEIIDSINRKKIENLFFKQWLEKEK